MTELSHRTVAPVRGLRAAGRGGACGDRRRRRFPAFRRDGQPLCPEPHDRPAGVRGAEAARHDPDRRPPDGEACRPHRSRLREGGRRDRELPSRSLRARRPHDRAHPRVRMQARARVQSGDAARLARPHDRQARPRADHVGEPGLRRAVVHPGGARQARARARAHRRRAAAHGPRHPARSRRRGEGRQHRGRSRRAGADTFVAGSAIFGAPDYAATIARMRAELAAVGERAGTRLPERFLGRPTRASST